MGEEAEPDDAEDQNASRDGRGIGAKEFADQREWRAVAPLEFRDGGVRLIQLRVKIGYDLLRTAVVALANPPNSRSMLDNASRRSLRVSKNELWRRL